MRGETERGRGREKGKSLFFLVERMKKRQIVGAETYRHLYLTPRTRKDRRKHFVTQWESETSETDWSWGHSLPDMEVKPMQSAPVQLGK